MVARPLRIGMIAPAWLEIPPPAYGGIELMLAALCVGLQRAGHDITLFTIGDSTCDVPKRWLFEHADPDRVGMAVIELRHVAAAYDALREVDIVHDHTLSGLFYSERFPELPVVATNHGPFNTDLNDLFGRVAGRIPVIAISNDQARHAPPTVPIARVILHGIDLDRYPASKDPGEHLLFLGRMSPDKGVDIAIRLAKQVGIPLLIAAKMREAGEMRYFRDVVEPMLDDTVRYVGEIDFATKIELLTTARALINPIRWPEPFGLVMIEAMACGTPVVGFDHGAAPEIVDSGLTGFLAADQAGLAEGLARIDVIDRRVCRQVAVERFSADRMAADHIDLYRDVLAERTTSSSRPITSSNSLEPPSYSGGVDPDDDPLGDTAHRHIVTRDRDVDAASPEGNSGQPQTLDAFWQSGPQAQLSGG